VTYIQKEDEARIVKNSHLPTIKRIPDKLWDEIRKVLSKEKPLKTVGRPIVKYRLVLDGVLYVLRTRCQWKKMLTVVLTQIGYTFNYLHGLHHVA